jgi:chromosome segregation ATPase
MRNPFIRYSSLILALLMIVALCGADADARQRRKRRHVRRAQPRRVITNPTITPPTDPTSEEKIITSGDEGSTQPQDTSPRKPASEKQMQNTIDSLSHQVNQLTEKLGQMQDDQRSLMDMERLTRAEQRAETLRAQLRDVQDKETDLQSRRDALDEALKPENIERVVAMYGTVHPEEARDARRKQLQADKNRIESQLNTLATSRIRLEAAIATADTEVDTLRQKMEKVSPDSGRASPATTDTNSGSPPPPKRPRYP